jgi:hypothetical protein
MKKQSRKPDGRRKGTSRKRVTLQYPASLKPEDLLDFIELPIFTARWEKLGLDDEDDLTALQITIMTAPTAARVIVGTSGLRKLRFAPMRWETGKSGATRVLYVYFEQFATVLLCLVYGKNEIGAISDGGKKYINKLIAEIEQELHIIYSR